MPRARIEIDAVVASKLDATLSTLVQLSNDDVGDETSYLWEILDQPAGAADALSASSIENPTVTPLKEGTYLLRLTVDKNLDTETSDMKLVAVPELKTYDRVPAAMETTEADPTTGWKGAVNTMLRRQVGTHGAQPVIVCAEAGASNLGVGVLVGLIGETTIKTGLPGEEVLLIAVLGSAETAIRVSGLMGVSLGEVDGGPGTAAGDLLNVLILGVYSGLAGAPAQGDNVYVSDAGLPALTAGTTERVIGHVLAVGGGVYSMLFSGLLAESMSPVGTPFFTADKPWGVITRQVGQAFWSYIGFDLPSYAHAGAGKGSVSDADGHWIWIRAGGAGAATNMIYENWARTQTRMPWGAEFRFQLRLLNGTVSTRDWIGLVTADPSASDTPAQHLAAFRHSTVAGDANWQAVSDDGSGVPEITDTGVVYVDDVPLLLSVDTESGEVRFAINGVLVATHTTKVPSDATDLRYVICNHRIAGAAVNEIRFGKIECSWRNIG